MKEDIIQESKIISDVYSNPSVWKKPRVGRSIFSCANSTSLFPHGEGYPPHGGG